MFGDSLISDIFSFPCSLLCDVKLKQYIHVSIHQVVLEKTVRLSQIQLCELHKFSFQDRKVSLQN